MTYLTDHNYILLPEILPSSTYTRRLIPPPSVDVLRRGPPDLPASRPMTPTLVSAQTNRWNYRRSIISHFIVITPIFIYVETKNFNYFNEK